MTQGPKKSHGRRTISATATPRELVSDRPRLKGAWTAKIITLVPEAYPGQLGVSIVGRALADGKWALEPIDLRLFGEGKHRNVDDTPSGGGAGMVLRADVMGRAVRFAQKDVSQNRARWPLVYLSPRGRRLDQAMAERFAAADGITLIAGRFEGLDQRVIDHFEIEEVSLGDFVMTGGDIAAEALIDATVRLRAGVLGNAASTEEESFSGGFLEHPQYTRPASWEGRDIPEILTSGDHGKVDEWRRLQAEKITRERRPEMIGERLPMDPKVAMVVDAEGFTQFLRRTYGQELEPYSSFNAAEDAVKAILACVEDNNYQVDMPSNPWTAAALLFWMGHVYE